MNRGPAPGMSWPVAARPLGRRQIRMRILVAADGSSHANRALDFAARLAKELKGVEVTLINVGHIPITESPPIGNPGYVDYGAMEEALERAGRQILEYAAKPFAANDMRVTPLYRSGDPAAEIIRAAREKKVELIIVGARGLSQLSGLILGSVSEKVLHVAPCPVIVVR